MSNLMSVLPISSGESPSLPPLKERNTLLGDERPFARWLEESCRDRSRQSPRENGKPKSNSQDKSSSSPSVEISAAPESAGTDEALDEMPPGENTSPLLQAHGQEEEPAVESPNTELSEESLLGTEESAARIPTPFLSVERPAAERPPSAGIPKPMEAEPAMAEPTGKPAVEVQSPPPNPAPAPGIAQAEDKVSSTDSFSSPPTPAPVISTPSESAATTPQQDVDMDIPSDSVPPLSEASDGMPPPDWTAEAAEETMETLPPSLPAPSTPSTSPSSSASETSTAVPETVEPDVTQVPGADSSDGFGEKSGSRSFQSHQEAMAQSAIPSQPAGSTSETLSTEMPAPLPPPSSATAPLPPFMQPAVLAQNLDRLVLHSVRSDSHSIRIELEPVSLGRVTLQCRETSEGLSVEIQVQSNQIRSLLSAQEQDLRDSLESQGMQMGKFSVTCRDGEGRSDGDRPGQHRNPDSPDGEGRQIEAKPASGTSGTERGNRMGTRNRWVA